MSFLYRGIIAFFILLLLPLFEGIALAIIFWDGFPFLYRQKRTGKGGKPFVIYKFRTMVIAADKQQNRLVALNEAHHPAFKIHNDPRFTRVGKFLSHTGLDELPQLFNVLKGDMALIGPRPLPVSESAKLKKWQHQRSMVKPGIISPWIFEGYHRQSFNAWMKSDIAYAKTKNIQSDAKFFYRAIVLLGRLTMRELVEKT